MIVTMNTSLLPYVIYMYVQTSSEITLDGLRLSNVAINKSRNRRAGGNGIIP